MASVSVAVKGQDGAQKAFARGENQTALVWTGEYAEGDCLVFETDETDAHYKVRIDDTMDEAFVYLTNGRVVYTIPFGEKRVSYNPKTFAGDRHYISIRKALCRETSAYRNLAGNVMDQHGDKGCFPHSYANVETRGEAVFAARNAIDGVLANESHGEWPYESWGINRQDDAEFTLDFGRPVDIDTIVLYTRADFPHDNWWVKADITCSDGTVETVEMNKSAGPHQFSVEKKGITWIKLGNLIKADDPSPFPALTQIEVYGLDS